MPYRNLPERDGAPHYLERELSELFASSPGVLHFLLDVVLDGAWYWDLENPEVEWMSPQFWRTLRHDPADRTHRAEEWQTLIHPEDLSLAVANFERHVADPNHPYDQLVRYRRGDGEGWATVRCHGVAIRDAEGRARRMLGAHVDVTRYVELQEKLRSGELMKSVLDATSSAIVGVDVHRRIVFANDAARALFNLSTAATASAAPAFWPENFAFCQAEDLSPLDASRDPLRQGLAGVAIRNEIFALIRGPGQEPRYVRFSSALCEAADETVKLVLSLDDVTDEFRARQAELRANRLDALGQLTGGIAHDFNNVLGAILPSIQLALLKSRDPELKALLETALRATRKGAELSRRLLSFASSQPVRAEDASVAEVFAEALEITRRTIETSIALEIVGELEGLAVHCDRGELYTTLVNLIVNARDAIVSSGKGSRITLSATRIDARDESGSHVPASQALAVDERTPMVAISVADDGPGMTVEVARRATDPFFTTKAGSEGSGLGLSMAFGFARQAGGDLRIDTAVGAGATVTLTLPAALRAERSATRVDKWVAGRGLSVLLVEDEDDLRFSTSEVLELLGYEVAACASGEDALAVLRSDRAINVLLTDIVMPGGVDGFTLAERAQMMRAGIGCVFMSGYVGYSQDKRIHDDAVFLKKPCDIGQLARALASVTRPSDA